MNVPPQLLEEFAGLVADQVVARLELPTTTEQPEPWRLLTLDEAASRLGRSTRWIRERVRRGELAHVRLDGGALAFEVEDLQAFAASRRVAAEPGTLAGRLQLLPDPAGSAGSRDRDRVGDRRVRRG